MVDLAARFSAPSTLLCRANVRWRHSESNVSCLTVCATITFSSAPRTRGCFQEPYCCKLIRYGAAARAYLKVLARRPASGRFGLVDRTEPALAGIHFHLGVPPVRRVGDRMHSPRPTLALIVQSGDGAPAEETAPSNIFWASIGTLRAPSTVVETSRCRHSQGAMNAPDQRPALDSRAAICSRSFVRVTHERLRPTRSNHPGTLTSSPSTKHFNPLRHRPL